MKLANVTLSTLALVLASSGFSAAFSVQGDIISSQNKLNAEAASTTDSASLEGVDSETSTAPGIGLSLQYKLTEALRLGGGLAWTSSQGDKNELEYEDFSVAGNATYDVYTQNNFAVYGLGGLSYHRVDPKDRKDGLMSAEAKNADLLNYDLGLGGRLNLTENVNFSLAYRYSDTLAKGTINWTGLAAGTEEPTKSKLKDVALQTNEVIASVGYSF